MHELGARQDCFSGGSHASGFSEKTLTPRAVANRRTWLIASESKIGGLGRLMGS